ncbi:hypothetical protein LEP3755_02980 [Leptolyngbya sp. NIES-3755]|nr:hypothetical protein LEP3755_02980 [Leptolyngbya sp. NIES-3755]
MTLTIIENASTFNLLSWLIATASRCALTESKAFETLLINAVLVNHTERPPFWKLVLISLWRTISIFLWVILILVILSSLGRHAAFGEPNSSVAVRKANVAIENGKPVPQLQESKIKADLDTALIESRETALKVASDELDIWIADLMKRVDDPNSDGDFLDWYFGYWTQQKFGLDAVTAWGVRRFNKNSPTVKEKIQETVLQEFTNKVFRPEIAKLELKTISRDVSQVYTDELRRNLEKVRIRYNIPTADWNSYLQDLTVSVTDFNGRQVPLNLKAVAVGSVGGSVVLAKGALLAIEKVTAKIGAKVVAKAAASVSAKVGAVAGGEFLGPAATVAIIAWDAIDIHNTEVRNRPELKQNIEAYFKLMKGDIVGDGQNGIQKLIADIEDSVRKSVTTSRFPFLNF